MTTHTKKIQKTLFLRIFFVLFVVFAISMIAVVIMQNTAVQPSNANIAVEKNSNVSSQSTIVNASTFLNAHTWYSPILVEQRYTQKSAEDIYTYEFSTTNAIIEMPVSYTGTIEEAFDRVSAQQVSIQHIQFERVVGASAKDGSRVDYAVIPYNDTRILVVRGSSNFVDSVLDTLEFAQE